MRGESFFVRMHLLSLDTEAEALEELLVFMMGHYRMPDAVFREIVDLV